MWNWDIIFLDTGQLILCCLHLIHHGVWDDVTMVSTGDSWCDSCKVAIAPRNVLSKESMRINVEPLKYLFMDCVPSPGVMRGIPECSASDFLLLCCTQCKYLEKLNMQDKTTAETIRVLEE